MVSRPVLPQVDTVNDLKAAMQMALDKIANDVNRAISSPLDAKSSRLTGVGKPASAQDAVPLGYLNEQLKKIESNAIKAATSSVLNELNTPADAVNDVNITFVTIEKFLERNTKIAIKAIYDHPVSGEFTGVAPVFEWYDGHIDTDTNKPVTTALTGTCTMTIPRPAAGGLGGILHLLAYNTTAKKKYESYVTAPVERWENIAISQAILDLYPVAPEDMESTSPNPTGVTIDGDTSLPNDYNLIVQWTPSTGGVAGYEVELKIWADAGLTTVLQDWRRVSSVTPQTANKWISDRWARWTQDIYYKARVRSYNSGTVLGAWVESSSYKKIPKGANFGQVTSQVTGLTLSTNVNGEWPSFFQIQLDWTNPADLDAVVGVRPEFNYYTDAGGTTPLNGSDWSPLGNRLEILTQYKTAWLPRPVTGAYLRCRLALINAIDEPGPFVNSNLVYVDAVVPPAAPSAVSVVVGEQARGGVKEFNYTITITPSVNKLDTDWYEAWVQYYSNIGGTTPISEWIHLGGLDPAINVLATDYWAKPSATQYAKVRVAAKAPQGVLSTYVYSSVLTIPSSAGVVTADPNLLVGIGAGDLRVDANGRIYINDVDLSKAYNFQATEFDVIGGKLVIKEVVASKIVTGTLGAGVIYAGNINVSKLTAGTANFSGDVTFTRGGNSVTINASGVTLVGGSRTASLTSTSFVTDVGQFTGDLWVGVPSIPSFNPHVKMSAGYLEVNAAAGATYISGGNVDCFTVSAGDIDSTTKFIIDGTNGATSTPTVATGVTVTVNTSWPGSFTGTFSDPPTQSEVNNLKTHLNNLIADLGGTVVRAVTANTTTLRFKGGICTGTS